MERWNVLADIRNLTVSLDVVSPFSTFRRSPFSATVPWKSDGIRLCLKSAQGESRCFSCLGADSVVDDLAPWRQYVCSILQIRLKFCMVAKAREGLHAVQRTQN